MEDKLIVAVCSRRLLYDTRNYNYRNRNLKEDAWKSISMEIGVPVEDCRKRWKNLRDMYLKERRKDMDKRSGSAGATPKKWRYSEVLSFLDPFVAPRETSGNMEPCSQEQSSVLFGEVEDLGGASQDSGRPPSLSTDRREDLSTPSSPSPAGQSSSGTSSPIVSGPPRRRRRAVPDTSDDAELVELIKQGPKVASATEHFMMSLVPTMDKLPESRLDVLKFKIHRLVLEDVYGENQ